MAIAQVKKLGAGNRIRTVARLLLTAAALLAPSAVSAQVSDSAPSRPLQPREALRAAQASYRRGEYEAAAQFYQAAESNKLQLTSAEQADLAAQLKGNNTALQASRDGAAHLRHAEEALQQGKLQEASALLRSENANQYLKPEDKARLVQLQNNLASIMDQLGANGGAGKGPGVEVPKEDYRTLVNMARTAFQRGDLDVAETFCKQAEKKAGVLPTMPWNDSTSKVMRDVQAARLKQAPARDPRTQESKQEQPSMLTSGLTKVKSMFTPGSAPTKSDNEGPQLDADKNVVAGPAATPQQQQMQPEMVVSKETLEARMLRDKAIQALTVNDLVSAKKYAEQAKARMDPGSWWERPSPDELLRDINKYLGEATPASASNGGQWQQASGSLPPVDSGNARNRLKDARALFAQGKIDEADRLCGQIVAVKLSWGLFEDNPDKLRGDIRAIRQRTDKAEAVKVLAEARKLMAAGNYEEARANAWKAKQLHGAYNMWDLGDRPDKLLADVDIAEAKFKKQGGTDQVDIAKGTQNKSTLNPNGPKMPGASAPSPVSVAAISAKQRAQGLLEEARGLQSQARLAEAQAKALEARAAAIEACRAGLDFGPGEESPDLFLIAMASQAKARIDGLVRVAEDNTAANDPFRLKKAADCLVEARQLAMQFGLDVMPLDIKLSFVMQRQGNPSAVMPAAGQATVQDSMGLKLLEDARKEITAGRLAQARRFAEEAFEAKYGVQKEAGMVLRSIDIETFEQNRLEADRAFIAANDAFQARDYRRAQGILANIDDRLLSDRYKGLMREIAMHPQMQPGQMGGSVQRIAATQINAEVPGKANASDLLLQGGKAAGDEFSLYKAMMDVEKDKLMKEGLVAQRTAMERAKDGDFDAAIDVLRIYTANLAGSGLDPEQQGVLRKSADRYVQQYQTQKAQRKFQEEQRTGKGGAGHNEQLRTIKQQEKESEIVKLADQGAQLLRERKFKEAHVVYLKIQDLDPENPAAATGIIIANTSALEQRNKEIDIRKREFMQYGTEGDFGPYVETEKPWAMNAKRFEKAQTRKEYSNGISSQLKDPVERAIERALWEKKVTLSWENVPLKQCIKDIKDYVGMNIITDNYALEHDGIRLDRPVTLTVTDMNLQSALNSLLRNANLTYVIQNQSITITTEEYAKGNKKMVIYPVLDLVTPVESIRSPQSELIKARLKAAVNQQLNPNGYNAPTPYNQPGSLPPGTPVGSATGPGGANTLTGLPPKPTGQTMEELLIRLITHTIHPETWEEVGGKGTIQYYPLGSALVVNQTQDIQEQIIELLQALRRLQDLEVAIEMRLVSVSEAFFEFMGVNFSVNLPTGNSASSIGELLSGVYAPATLPNKFSSPGFVSGLTPAGTLTPDLGVPIKASSFGFSLPPFGGYPGTLGADGGISLGLAFLSDIQVAMFMEAAQGDRRANVMQAPKITVFNGQTANINVGDQLTFLDTINVVQINGQTVFQPQQNPQFFGVFLTVTPVVSADRRFVRLNLAPTLQNLVSATVPLLPIQQLVPQLFYDGISPPQPAVFQLFFQQPSTSFITLDTTVVVPDGGTVLMGGLKTLVEGRNEFGPPVLGKIPYLDRLFRNVGYGREAQSLMIMVTARIIINEEEELEFRGELQRIPR